MTRKTKQGVHMICENCMWWKHRIGEVGECKRKEFERLRHYEQACHKFLPKEK